jgi:hypothetical protein
MANYQIEISRNNVTLAQFFAMVKFECKKRGIDFYLNKDEFENPTSEYLSSYTIIGDKKKCYFEEMRDITEMKRKLASYTTHEGFTRYYYTDEFEPITTRKREHWQSEELAEDAPCKAEKFCQFACNYQTYVLNFDGSCYNEICEFTFDDDKTGHGYYYQLNKDAA